MSEAEVGVGLDVVEIDRLARIMARRPAFVQRYFTEGERTRAEALPVPARHLALVLSAKEAFLKAIRKGVLGGVPLDEVEVVAGPGELPRLSLGPRARSAMDDKNFSEATVSWSDDGRRAFAVVVLGR